MIPGVLCRRKDRLACTYTALYRRKDRLACTYTAQTSILLGISIFHWCWVPGKKLGTPNRLLVFKNKLNVMQDKLDSHEMQNAYCTAQAGATI